jgi:hypothetical protein
MVVVGVVVVVVVVTEVVVVNLSDSLYEDRLVLKS